GAGGEVSYRLCGREGHHHHLICRVCGRTVEVAGAGVEEWARRMGAAHGFTEIEHVVELTGTSRDCARRRAA
ncbi:MAG: transcriptional repressor, partial [Bifidobacteriaceae bacterium]|nr:transcriptional repressor [Bifidobacteriaceae bacterium]